MSKMGKNGITADTPKNILLGAGTIHKNLAYASGNWTGTVIGATSGGSKVTVKGEFLDLELDGALVKFRGQTVKVGGTATIETNFAEVTADNLKMATLFKEGTTDAEGYTMLVDKPNISTADYVENFGFVGKTADGSKDIIVIFEYGLCVSGLELDNKNKAQTVYKYVIDAYADEESDLDTIPVKIYYPVVA